MLSRLLLWLDASSTHYTAAAWLAFALAAVVACLGPRDGAPRAWWRHPALFAAAMLLALLAFRWPILLNNRQLADPDESQMMAGALTLEHDGRFWQSVDGTTHGPIAQWALLVPHLGGVPIDYTLARAVSVFLCWVALLAAWAVFRHLFGDWPGRLYALPLLALYAFTPGWYFVAYCSEHTPEALLAVGGAALLTAWDRDGRAVRRGRLFLAGLALGAVPFAKLQAVSSALWVAFAGAVLLLATTSLPWRERGRALGTFILGGLALPAAMFAWIAARGIWADFWSSYISNNLQYANARWFPWSQAPGKFVELLRAAPEYAATFWWLLGAAVVGLLALPRFTSWHRRCALLALGLCGAALFATMSPGKIFQHYLQLTFFSTALFAGLAGGSLIASLRTSAAGRPPPAWVHGGALLLWLAATLGPQIRWRAHEGQPHAGAFTQHRGRIVRSAAAEEIRRHARRGERMAIWGWMPNFWVETKLIQGTRDSNTWRQIEAFPDRDYYRQRFVRDLEANRPPVFVDAVGGNNFSYTDRAAAAHETYPPLRDYIAAHYRLVRDVEGARIYLALARP